MLQHGDLSTLRCASTHAHLPELHLYAWHDPARWQQCGACPLRGDVYTPPCVSWRIWKVKLPRSSAGSRGSGRTRMWKPLTCWTTGAEAPSSCWRSTTSSRCYDPETAWWTVELHLEPGARWPCRGSTQRGQVRGQTGVRTEGTQMLQFSGDLALITFKWQITFNYPSVPVNVSIRPVTLTK